MEVNKLSDANNKSSVQSDHTTLEPLLLNGSFRNSIAGQGAIDLLESLCDRGVPADDLVLQFVEELDRDLDTCQFTNFLHCIPVCLKNVCSQRKDTNLAWCLNAIQTSFFKSTTLDCVQRFSAIRDFYWDVRQDRTTNTTILSKYAIQLLAAPQLDRHNDLNEISYDFIRYVLDMERDPYKYLLEINLDESQQPDLLALGLFFYTIYVDGVQFEVVPKIYDSQFVFHRLLIFICDMLKTSRDQIVQKALKLTETILNTVRATQLPYELLECDQHANFCTQLAKLIIYHNDEELRKFALDLFQRYLWNFRVKARFCIISNLYRSMGTNSNFKGYLIVQFKEISRLEHVEYHNDMDLCRIVIRIFKDFLKWHIEENLVENSDQIVAVLNLLRFHCLTGRLLVDLQSDVVMFIRHLDDSIQWSRGYYEGSRTAIINDNTSHEQQQIAQIQIAGDSTNHHRLTSRKCQLDHLALCSTTVDVIDSLLTRVKECFTQYQQNILRL